MKQFDMFAVVYVSHSQSEFFWPVISSLIRECLSHFRDEYETLPSTESSHLASNLAHNVIR